MQPLDDLLPAEMDSQNEEMLVLLCQSHGIAGVIAGEPESQHKALALAAVRQRLLEARRAEEPVQPHTLHLLEPVQASNSPVKQAANPSQRRGKRGLALFAAMLCMALLVGSMLTILDLTKRGNLNQKPRPNSQASTQHASQALYIATSGWLQKVDATTGVLIWQAQLPRQKESDDPPINFPLVGNDAVYVTADNTLLAFNATNGNKLWNVKLNDGLADPAGGLVQPVLANGRLYYGLQVNASDSRMVLDVFDASSGHVLWQYNPHEMIAGIAVANKSVYITFDTYHDNNPQNTLSALDVTNGLKQWSVVTDAGHAPEVSVLNTDSELVVKSGVIYHLLSGSACGKSTSKCIYAYRADNGAFLWHSQNLMPASFAQNEIAFAFEGGLVAAGNALYVNSTGGLCALDASNGQLLWCQTEGSRITSQPPNHPLSQPFAGKGISGNPFVVVGKSIFRMEMTAQGNYLVTLNASNGKVMIRQRVEDFYSSLTAQVTLSTKQYTGSLLFEGLMTDTISYVFPSTGQLDALNNSTGARLWSIHLAGGEAAVLMSAP